MRASSEQAKAIIRAVARTMNPMIRLIELSRREPTLVNSIHPQNPDPEAVKSAMTFEVKPQEIVLDVPITQPDKIAAALLSKITLPEPDPTAPMTDIVAISSHVEVDGETTSLAYAICKDVKPAWVR